MDLKNRRFVEFNNKKYYEMIYPIKTTDYWISIDGEVLSFKRKNPHIIAQNKHKDGYLRTGLTIEEKVVKSYLVHRLIAFNFISNDDPIIKGFVNHKDGNKRNNNINNLEWTTKGENQSHSYQTLGRINPDEKILLVLNNYSGLLFEPTNRKTLTRKNVIQATTTKKMLQEPKHLNDYFYCQNDNKIEQWHNGKVIQVFNEVQEIANKYNTTVGQVNKRIKLKYCEPMQRYRILLINDLYKDWTKTNIPYTIIKCQK